MEGGGAAQQFRAEEKKNQKEKNVDERLGMVRGLV